MAMPPVQRVPGPVLPTVAAYFEHQEANRPIMYGAQYPGGRAPSAFIKASAKDLTQYLLEDPKGPFLATADEWSDACQPWEPAAGEGVPVAQHKVWGFAADSSEPILKADWHAIPGFRGESQIFTPRFGKVGVMRSAPPRVWAFVEAFRDANSAVWDKILHGLEGLKEREAGREKQPWDEVRGMDRLASIFTSSLQRRNHFGAIEAQVWAGGSISMRSHMDGATSLMHLGITLGGERVVRISRFAERHSPQRSASYTPDARRMPWKSRNRQTRGARNDNDVWDGNAVDAETCLDVDMEPGSVYLSSPYCFEHGVRYPPSYKEPIIALQCRFALLNETDATHVNGLRDGAMREIATVVAQALSEATTERTLRLPSVAEVAAKESQPSEEVLKEDKSQASSSSAGARRSSSPKKAPGDAPPRAPLQRKRSTAEVSRAALPSPGRGLQRPTWSKAAGVGLLLLSAARLSWGVPSRGHRMRNGFL